jgi:hypothetical protein
MLIMLAESRHRRCKLLRHPAYAGLSEIAPQGVTIACEFALCRREGIAESPYYTWSKEFLEAGKRLSLPKTPST